MRDVALLRAPLVGYDIENELFTSFSVKDFVPLAERVFTHDDGSQETKQDRYDNVLCVVRLPEVPDVDDRPHHAPPAASGASTDDAFLATASASLDDMKTFDVTPTSVLSLATVDQQPVLVCCATLFTRCPNSARLQVRERAFRQWDSATARSALLREMDILQTLQGDGVAAGTALGRRRGVVCSKVASGRLVATGHAASRPVVGAHERRHFGHLHRSRARRTASGRLLACGTSENVFPLAGAF